MDSVLEECSHLHFCLRGFDTRALHAMSRKMFFEPTSALSGVTCTGRSVGGAFEELCTFLAGQERTLTVSGVL